MREEVLNGHAESVSMAKSMEKWRFIPTAQCQVCGMVGPTIEFMLPGGEQLQICQAATSELWEEE